MCISPDELLLTPADYAAEFEALIPLLKEKLGDKFRSANLQYWHKNTMTTLFTDRPPLIWQHNCHKENTVLWVITDSIPQRYVLHGNRIECLTTPYRIPVADWVDRIRSREFCSIAKARMAPIKEELIAAAWAPERVERLLTAGGFDALD